MALVNRINRLFRADFNAVLDRIEEPDILLQQAIRDMEEDIHFDNRKLKILYGEISQIKLKVFEVENEIEKINEELDICFNSNELELARSQVKRKLEMQLYEKNIKNKFTSIESEIKKLEERIHENSSRFTSMQQKLDLIVEKPKNTEFGSFVGIKSHIDENDVEIALLREKQERSIS